MGNAERQRRLELGKGRVRLMGSRIEMIVAICAALTSVVALFIGWDQARIMRLQQRADVWPMVQVTHVTDANSQAVSYSILLENAGVGPAMIERHAILIPGKETTEDFYKLVEYIAPEALGPGEEGYSSIDGRVVRQGHSVSPITARWPSTPEANEIMQARVAEFVSGDVRPAHVFVCYCSILKECWISSTLEHQLRPHDVKSCQKLNAELLNIVAMYGS